MTHPTGLSRAWIERLVESNILGITVEQDGTIVEANDAFLGMLGYTRDDLVAGRLRSRDLTPPEYADLDARALDDMLRHGGYAPLEKEVLRKDGSRVTVLIGAAALSRAPLTSVAFVLDLTERKALEARGRRAQRMESIIRLAGGIAHDFNNQLTAILGSAELLLENRALDPEGRADVEQIRKAANRAAQLARQLLAFSRRQASQPRVLDLNAVLDEIRPILRHLVGERIEVVTDLDPAGAPALADLAQLEQTIVDAALHARDRMPDGGRLTLRAGDGRRRPARPPAGPLYRAHGPGFRPSARSDGGGPALRAPAERRVRRSPERAGRRCGAHAVPARRRAHHPGRRAATAPGSARGGDDPAGGGRGAGAEAGAPGARARGVRGGRSRGRRGRPAARQPPSRHHPSAGGGHDAAGPERPRARGPARHPPPSGQGALHLGHGRRRHRPAPGAGPGHRISAEAVRARPARPQGPQGARFALAAMKPRGTSPRRPVSYP